MPRRPRPLRRLASLLVAGIVGSLALLTPVAAQSHPFGDPQTVEVSRAEGEVRVRWRAGGADDLTLLAIQLGALPAERVMLDGAVWYEDGDADALAASPAFHAYLLDRITVAAGGSRCGGDVTGLDLLGDGAALAFVCPGPVAEATVEVRTLLDLHPAYRTLATGPAGQRAVYDRTSTTHDWSLDRGPVGSAAVSAASADLGRSAAVQLSTVGAVALATVLAGLLWVRRRGRRS